MGANRAIVIHGAGDVRVEERPPPTADHGQAVVNIIKGGICGSDISYFNKGAVGDFKVRRPMVLGHEIVGRVTDLGPGVDDVDSDEVVVNPSQPCGRCARCVEGRPNVCLSPTFLGSASTNPHVDGGFASELAMPVTNLVAVPSGLAPEDVVFAEPLAVGVHAIGRAGGVEGKNVLVIGAGPIGAMTLAAARAMGASQVDVSDLSADRLAIATDLGAGHADEPDEAAARAVSTDGYDVVFEASGSAPGMAAAIEAARKGGTVVMIGLPHGGPLAIPLGLGVARELDILGSFRFSADEFADSVRLLGDGLDLSLLRSHTFDLDHVHDAFTTASGPESMKVQIDFADLLGAAE